MINVENLDFSYKDKIIFKNTKINISDNKLSVILGCNGCGKSTLLKLITNNIKSGIKIENTFKNVFYLPQNPYYPTGITVFDYLSSVFFKNNWKWFLSSDEKNRINDVLKTIGLSDKKYINIECLSGGEIQKANIGLGLLSDADLFLLDEPTSNMDIKNQIKILKMLKELTTKNITSVIILHDINLALKYGDEFIGVTTDYKVIKNTNSEFFNPEILKNVYDMDFSIIKDNNNTYVQIVN